MTRSERRITIPGMAAVAALGAAVVWVSWTSIDRPGPLEQYVARPDDSYAWSAIGSSTIGTTEVLELRLRSQTWRGGLWQHRLFVLRPKRLLPGHQALLVIGGGRWRPEYDDTSGMTFEPDDAALFARIAETLETIVVVVGEVPFQPLFDLTEDQLIAYTLDEYLQDRDPDWPLLLPMTKSAVRAMDAGTAAARQAWGIELASFTVVGGSKRGWTAWLTAVVDDRVTAIAPIVIDALNMAEHFPHQIDVWGAPSAAIRPYTERNLHIALSTDADLREIVDPYAYRDALTLPKLIVNATNDEYFPIDSANLYWDGLRGAKYALYLPNEGHSAEDTTRLIASLGALHRAAAGREPMAGLSWRYALDQDVASLCVVADPQPGSVRIWVAVSDDRDFRDERWESSPLESAGGSYRFERRRDPSAWIAIYAEAAFAAGDTPYTLTTTPAVLGPATGGRQVWSATSSGRACNGAGSH